jgi:Flp pilus assembly protein TadG
MKHRDCSGTITLWLLGLCLLMFALGGMSLDLWRGFSTRRALSASADAAALAGASAIDEDAYRETGEIRLDPVQAEARARAHLVRQLDRNALRAVDVNAGRDAVVVTVDGTIDLTLLGIVDPGGAVQVRTTAVASPRRSG